MAGMPSARGVEFKGHMASANFAKGFDNIPRNPDGTMVVDPAYDPIVEEEPKYPRSCSVCTIRNGVIGEGPGEISRPPCPDAFGCQSAECKERFATYGGIA